MFVTSPSPHLVSALVRWTAPRTSVRPQVDEYSAPGSSPESWELTKLVYACSLSAGKVMTLGITNREERKLVNKGFSLLSICSSENLEQLSSHFFFFISDNKEAFYYFTGNHIPNIFLIS